MNAMRGINVSVVIIIDDSSSLISVVVFEIDERIVSSLVTSSTLDLIHSSFSNGLFKSERRLNSRRTDCVLIWKYF